MSEGTIQEVERAVSANLSQGIGALRAFTQDMIKAAKGGRFEEAQQITAGLALYDGLPKQMKLNELSELLEVHFGAILGWMKKELLSPTREETRPVLRTADSIARPTELPPSPLLFDKEQIMASLMLAAHKKIPELKKKNIAEILKDPDWSSNPKNLSWISHFLINKSERRDFYTREE